MAVLPATSRKHSITILLLAICSFGIGLRGSIQEDEAILSWTPATAIPPSPTAAAQRFTEPERTSPAAKIPGKLVSSGLGLCLLAFQAGAATTLVPVLMNP